MIRLGRSYTTGWTSTSMYQRSACTWRSAPPSGLTAPRTPTCPSCSSCTEGRSICLFLLLFYWPIFRGVLWRHSDQDGRRKTWSLGRCCGGGDQLQGIVRNMEYLHNALLLSFALVCVQVGPLGFMCLDTDEAAGNMGMLDQGEIRFN